LLLVVYYEDEDVYGCFEFEGENISLSYSIIFEIDILDDDLLSSGT